MEKVLTHNRNSEKRIADIDSWNIPKQDVKDIREFLNAYERGEITGRIGTNIPATLERTTEYLKPIFIYLKSVYKLKKTDKKIIQNLLTAILKDEIKGKHNKPYSLKVKKFMLKTFVNYLKWKMPDDCFPLIKILNIRISNKLPEPEFLTTQEIEKLYRACSTPEQRYFIAVLFSSGTRAEEFHNILFEDIELPKGNEAFVKLRIKNTTSKTKGRTISLYWNKCLEATKEYLEQRISEGIKPTEPVFKTGYDTMRSWLRELGKKVLNKNVHYHLFRSSCATWMVDKLQNKAEYCFFFGWQFSSPMPDVYISRKGITFKAIDEKFKSTEIEELKTQLSKEEFERKKQREELEKKYSREAIEKQVSEILSKYMKEQKEFRKLKDYVLVSGSSMKQKPELKKN